MGVENIGAFAGGLASGIESGSQINVNNRKLQIAEEELQREQATKQQAQEAKVWESNVKNLENALKSISQETPGPVVKTPQEQRDALISQWEPILKGHPHGAKNPALAESVITSLRNTISDVELEAQTAQASAEGRASATPKKLSRFGGFDPQSGRKLIGFSDDAGNRFIPDEATGDLIPAPANLQIVSTTAQGSPDEVFSPDKKESRDLRTENRESLARLDQVSTTLADAIRTPGAGGVRGALVENVGGILGQIPGAGESLERAFAETIAGATPEEVQRVRTRQQVLVAQMLSDITGEESGRFTEAERALATKTLKGLPANASMAQIVTAMKSVMEISVDEMLRSSEALGKPRFDLSSDDGINSFGEFLTSLGFSTDEAINMIRERIKRGERKKL